MKKDGTEITDASDIEMEHLLVDNWTLDKEVRIGWLIFQFEETLDDIGLGQMYRNATPEQIEEFRKKTKDFFGVKDGN